MGGPGRSLGRLPLGDREEAADLRRLSVQTADNFHSVVVELGKN